MIKNFVSLVYDNDESVKLAAMTHCTTMAELFNTEEERGEHVLPIVTKCMEDRSWKVRNAIAVQYAALSKAMQSNIIESDMVAGLSNLLQDPEGEVRIAAAKSLNEMVDLVVVTAVRVVRGNKGVQRGN